MVAFLKTQHPQHVIRGALEMNIFSQSATPRARRRPILVSNEKFFKKIPSLGTNIFPQVLKDEFLEYILFQEFGYLSFLPCSRGGFLFHHSGLSDFPNASLSLVLRLRRGSFTSQLVEGEATAITAIDRSSAANKRYIHGVFHWRP